MKKHVRNSIHLKNLSADKISAKKRAFERIQKNICVKLLSGKSQYTGIIMNLSERGMFIFTKETAPLKPKLEILIPLKKEILKVQGTIKSLGKAGKIYNGVGVELLHPAKNYLKFISNLRTLY
jgi:hypothetical protein